MSEKPHSVLYYEKNFKKHADKIGSFFPCWNWAAFLWGPGWLAYRGMMKEAILGICLYSIIAYVAFTLGATKHILFLITLPLWIVLAVYGTSLYARKFKQDAWIYFGAYRFVLGVLTFVLFCFVAELLEHTLFKDKTSMENNIIFENQIKNFWG